MAKFNPTIGRWTRRRRNTAGKRVTDKKWVVNYRCPETGRKRRISFPTKAKAEAYRDALVAEVTGERYFNPNTNPNVAEVVEHWIETKRGTVKPQTISGYRPLRKIIVGPLLQAPHRSGCTMP